MPREARRRLVSGRRTPRELAPTQPNLAHTPREVRPTLLEVRSTSSHRRDAKDELTILTILTILPPRRTHAAEQFHSLRPTHSMRCTMKAPEEAVVETLRDTQRFLDDNGTTLDAVVRTRPSGV